MTLDEIRKLRDKYVEITDKWRSLRDSILEADYGDDTSLLLKQYQLTGNYLSQCGDKYRSACAAYVEALLDTPKESS